MKHIGVVGADTRFGERLIFYLLEIKNAKKLEPVTIVGFPSTPTMDDLLQGVADHSLDVLVNVTAIEHQFAYGKDYDELFFRFSRTPSQIATVAHLSNLFLVHVSSQEVLGVNTVHADTSESLVPTTVLGLAALYGERAVRLLKKESCVIRVGPVLDSQGLQDPRNKFSKDQIRELTTPVFAGHFAFLLARNLVEAEWELMGGGGVVHCAGNDGQYINIKGLTKRPGLLGSLGLKPTAGWVLPNWTVMKSCLDKEAALGSFLKFM